MPGAGHLVHMPAHIYYRVGLYRDALRANQRAIAVDEAYFRRSPSDPLYRSAYYPHNIHFLMVAAQLGGDGATALEAAAKLDAVLDPAMVDAIPALQPIKAAPYTVHALFSPPERLLQLPAPPQGQVLVRALWHHVRVLAQVRLQRFDAAAQELAQLAALEQQADFKPFEAWGVPASAIVQTAQRVAQARLAEAQGRLDDAAQSYEAAIALEDGLAYMEPPYWYYPIRQSLGALRLRQGRLDEAEQVLRESLARTRNNGWALGGLLAVYEQKGDRASAASTRAALRRAWFGPSRGPELALL
jgi:tetratricopeptide (TPR) repeat protein